MILSADLLLESKSKVFNRLLNRSHPPSLYTILTLGGRSTARSISSNSTVSSLFYDDRAANSPGSSCDGGGKVDDIYCLPQDIINAVEHVQSTQASGRSNKSPPPVPPVPRSFPRPPPPIPRRRSAGNTARKGEKSFFKNMSKFTNKPDENNSSVQEDNNPSASEDNASITYEVFDSVNIDRVEGRQEQRAENEIKVKTLALCWWSEKLNTLTDKVDAIVDLDPVFEGKTEEVRTITVLLSGGTVLTPTLQSAEAAVLFGLIYDIPELVKVNVQWINKHMKSSNYLEMVHLYERVRKYGECPEMEHAIRKFIVINEHSEVSPLLKKVIEQNADWVKIIGLNYIPISLLQEVNPDMVVELICTALEEELSKSQEDLKTSALMIKFISSDFKMFVDSLADSVTDITGMRALSKMERLLTKKIMTTMMSPNFASIINSIEAYVGKDDEAIHTDLGVEKGLFHEKKWRNASGRELLLALQGPQGMVSERGEGDGLIEFVVVEIVLEWIKYNKFELPPELCINVLAAVQKLDTLSADFVSAIIAETHALLGLQNFPYIESNLRPRPEPSQYKHVTQRFGISKENLELLILDQLVTLKSKCTLEKCAYVGTLSVVTINIVDGIVTPAIRLNLPSTKNQSNVEHTHYDYVHWCLTDDHCSELHGKSHFVSVMTKSPQELKSALASLDGCTILFFAKC